MEKLPEFNLPDYENLLKGFKDKGYAFRSIDTNDTGKTVFLRHDVDLHLHKLDQLAEIEHRHEVCATYYILLSANYNVMHKNNRQVIERLVSFGHNIGLHYDLEAYPINYDAAVNHLNKEVEILEYVSGTKVNSIVMHQPHKGMGDVFKEIKDFIHPHSEKYSNKYVYISDSCRAWRDLTLLNCLSGDIANENIHLNLHPELWLGMEKNRIDFLNGTLKSNIHSNAEELMTIIYNTWTTHPAVLLANERGNVL